MINLDSYAVRKTCTDQQFSKNDDGTYTATETYTGTLTQAEMDRIKTDLNSQKDSLQKADVAQAIADIHDDLDALNV